jgi:phage baseplate assembly protein W
MSIVNTVPSTSDIDIIKTLKFPFQLGVVGFPEMESPDRYSFSNIVALILTGLGERVMNVDLGVNIHEFLFTNMTPIQQVRLSSMVSTAIETFIPWVNVISVIPSQLKYDDGVGSKITFDITYSVGGQDSSQQIIYPPTVQGY